MADNLNKELQKQLFRSVNGRIMRNINMLAPKENTLGNHKILILQTVNDEDCLNTCFNYLEESGYIRIKGMVKEAKYTDACNAHCRVSVTGAGMELLIGIQENPAVEI
ncbi:MAG: hypothetical protein LBS36_05940 [Oscillospiraceae bacterium]|jgi:hypothetical protein|nr:hypothetical protein [Oscillospiraceae bacterium]